VDKLKLRYLIREAIENIANLSSKFSVGDKVTTVDGDTAMVTMAEHPFYTVELEATGTTKSFSFSDLAPYEEKIIAKTSEGISLQEGVNASPGLLFHQEHKINLSECIYRIGSNSYVEFFAEARKLFNEGNLTLNENDQYWIKNTDIGEYGDIDGKPVPLDIPFINEAEFRGKDVKLNKPKRGGSKAYYVYVKNPKTGRVKKVSFGSGGLRAKINNPKARKAFAARHNCKNKKDRTKAGYWSCNLPRYAKSLGLGANKNTFW
tara:strand:+ start:2401 stop:3186 length:786 start_codon:yes stop_codon:yes gene_type:complete